VRFRATKQDKSVGDEVQHGFKRRDGTLRVARQIHNEGAAAASGDGAAERCEWRTACAGSAHALGEAIEDAAADGTGGFRRNITRRNAGAAGGDDQPCVHRVIAQRCFDLRLFVRHKVRAFHGEAC
jgi:hypothetical protein